MSIKLKQLKPAQAKEYIYSDLHLDIEEVAIQRNGIGNVYGTDIRADYNMLAIKNNIRSIFNTRRGQRLLYPTFGVFLEEYLFEPISENTAIRIAEAIYNGITNFEDRVTVKNVNVYPIYEDNAYTVTVTLYVPILDINTQTDATLNKDGFFIL
jgi:phage baseplate assembly protein W